MANPHLTAMRAAERTSRQMAVLIGRLGTTDHPRGAILRAYRNAHRSLRDIIRSPTPMLITDVAEVLAGLRSDVTVTARTTLAEAEDLGLNQARAELEAYGIRSLPRTPSGNGEALEAWLGILEDQIVQSRSVIALGGDPALLIGDATRGGILQPGPVTREGARWLLMTAIAARALSIERAADRIEFRRQAIAALDERMTDCCLRVHGQVVGLEEDFHLTGTPRFADRMRDSPFHWYCRTSQALVRAEDADDRLTRQMKAAAQAELKARAEVQAQIDELKRRLADLGQAPDIRARQGDTEEVKRLRLDLRKWKARAEIHPAHARSRR